jgi:glycosyltransferase involved in cell wall biosynthesis
LVRAARQNGKKVVITPLLPYDTPGNRIRHIVRRLQGRRRVLLSLLRHTDRLLVVNDLQVESAVRIFGYPRDQVEIIPTIVDGAFFAQITEDPVDDLRNYIVCAGNIWPRKNQIRLAQAALAADVPMVFVGNVMGGEQAYTDEFQALIDRSGVALPSFVETQPAAGLEAAALRKPLLLGRRPYAQQSFFRNAYLADPASVADIARGLRRLLNAPDAHTPPADLIQQCRPEVIGQNLKRIFSSL